MTWLDLTMQIPFEPILTAMQHGAVIVTPNNRLSTQIINTYSQHQSGTSCDKPLCMPYQTLLHHIFDLIREITPNTTHPIILTGTQQRLLWRRIISEQSEYPCNNGLLNMIQDAWTRCRHWQIPLDDKQFDYTPQTRQYQDWQNAFQSELNGLHAITEEQLTDYLCAYPIPKSMQSLIWVCFDDYTPAQKTLQSHFEAEGCTQTHYEHSFASDNTTYHYPAHDKQDECLQMISFLKTRLAASDKRIGVVVPDLAQEARSLQRLIKRHIPETQWNISLGHTLLDFPLVTHALHWLLLDKTTLTHHQAALLLQSPYLSGSQTEWSARAHALQNHKLFKEDLIPVEALLKNLAEDTPKLVALLHRLTPYPAQASPSTWITHFKARLTTLGFPGEQALDSTTYQCFQRFNALFDDYMALGVIYPIMDQHDALTALRELAQSTIFQPQKPSTPIYILGTLEASGCMFDSVWIMGLTDHCLPQKIRPSPFIPLTLQRNLAMPHAIAERELHLATQLIQRLQKGAKRSVFSYPRLQNDIPNLPSPLITHFPIYEAPIQRLDSTQIALIPRIENYELPRHETETITGGSAILANQAQCPFRAFAIHRLHAKTPPTQSCGPDAAERGQVLHHVLELIWRHLQNQHTLIDSQDPHLDEIILALIQQALAPLIAYRPASFSPLIQSLEVARIKRLVDASLAWERTRPPFAIAAVEKTFSIQLAGIDFRVRVDRIDTIMDDVTSEPRQWVIDYKTSLPPHKPWTESRPEAPQLLLYALLDPTINGLLLIQLKAGRLVCSGFSEEPIDIKGITSPKQGETWSDYQKKWYAQLSALALEFQQGDCRPRPNRASICTTCTCKPLCRIQS